MFSILYISRADIPFTEPQLLDLLKSSRRNNLQQGITGMLLYKDGNFMQLIEGEEDAVRSVYQKIWADLRHRNVNVLVEGPVKERQFPTWSMGFQDLKSVDPSEVPGYNGFLNVPLTKQEFSANPSRGQELLRLFRKIG